MSQIFQNRIQYRTITNYRSAISAFHDYIQGKPVEEHPRICSLVADVFNSRPPQPKYCFIWNVQAVIDFIKSEWGQNEHLSDKYLTYKLRMLLALTSAFRVLGLQHLDIRFMTKGTNYYMFTFGKLHKAWRKGKSPSSLKFYSFEEDTKLWVVATLEKYLKKPKVWRGKGKSQLLLILWSVRQYLDGLRIFSERQVLILKFSRETQQVQPQHQKLDCQSFL